LEVRALPYYVGVDGGGTKTAIAATDKAATKILTSKTGSASWREYGIEPVVKNIKQTINALPFGQDDTIAAISLGLPCYGERADEDSMLSQAFHEAYPGIPIYFANDVEVGWAGSLGLEPGINVVAGTGAIAFGKDEGGKTVRSGGWSEFFGDEGSCYWIGRRVMELFSKQSDCRMERDALYEIVRREFRLANDFDFIDLMHSGYIMHRYKVASLQMLAKQAALAGSPSAKELYNAASGELCLLVRSIRDQLEFLSKPFLVSYTGGLFAAGDVFLPQFAKGVEAVGGKLITPRFGPAEGALLLTFSKFNTEALPSLQKSLNENKKT
jgi:N-acetylglucosamine kinase-like BadF-type ATPase